MHQLTATEFRASAKSCEEFVLSLLSNIAARDAQIKAWAYLNPENVLAQARKLDNIEPSRRGILHGVPIGVKVHTLRRCKLDGETA